MKRFAAAAVLLCSAGVVSAGPLGELEFSGDVRLTLKGSGETVTLRNSSHTLFAGDRIATGSFPASLRLTDGNSLAIAPNSELALDLDAGSLRADLTRGSMAYLLNGNGQSLQVNGGERLASGRLGMIAVSEGGRLNRFDGTEAEQLAEQSGLMVSGNVIGVACKDPNGCGAVRPQSLSP
ncbi:MAG: hypothetical protein ACXIUM_00660 [Wenzhouxiangella sp.]